jgi:hypothetical protein
VTDAFVIPELTRGLRAFASTRALGGQHDRVFGPLLDARRAAARAARWQDRVAAFDAERLEATLRVTLESIAAESHPDSPPDRRALAAQLADGFADTFGALAALRLASSAVRSAEDDGRRRDLWAGLTTALRVVFQAADEDWEAARDQLTRAGAPRGASAS